MKTTKRVKKVEVGCAICGGVVNWSTFVSDTERFMMAYVMRDRYFRWYVSAKNRGDEKRAKKLFEQHAFSAI